MASKRNCTSPTLEWYHATKHLIVSGDGSSAGLFVTLLQEDVNGDRKVFTYVLCSVMDCNSRYAQIEKEALALRAVGM